jgi:hypothetical protein
LAGIFAVENLERNRTHHPLKLTRLAAFALTGVVLSCGNAAWAAPIHLYDLNGNLNDGIGSANGTIFGTGVTYTTDRFGSANSALNFSASGTTGGYVQAMFSMSGSMTFTMWATRDVPNGTNAGMLFDTGAASSPDLFFPGNCGGAILWNTYDGCSNPVSGTNIASLGPGWHHYAVVASATNPMRLYIDGALVGTAAQRTISATEFSIGGDNNAAFYWDGKIDDVRVYNTALTASEVSDIAAGTAVPEPSTLALLGASILGLGRHLRRRESRTP